MAKRKINTQKKNKKFLYIVLLGLIALFSIFLISFLNRSNPTTFNDVTYYPVNIDKNREIVFSDANEIYRAKLDGSKPKKIGSFDRIVGQINVLPNGDVIIIAGGRYLEQPPKGKKSYKYDSEGKIVNDYYWIIKGNNKPEKLDESKYNEYIQKLVPDEYITNSLPGGVTEIIFKKDDLLTKIGFLNTKIDYWAGCDNGGTAYVNPRAFAPSFNGEYLISMGRGGGGTCYYERGVISRDGSKKFDIKLVSFERAIWIGDNKFIRVSDSGSDYITLNKDGTHNVEATGKDFSGLYDSERQLSPSKEYIAMGGDKGVAIYDIRNNKIIPLENTENLVFDRWLDDSNLMEFTLYDKKSSIIKKVIYDLGARKGYEIASHSQKPSIRDNSPKFQIR